MVRLTWPQGYQYSKSFLDKAESLIPMEALSGRILSFSQHFPRASTVKKAGGKISYYVDATFAALTSGRGLDLRLPKDVVKCIRQLEIENYEMAERIITMGRWARDSVIQDCQIAPSKVFTILPGANMIVPDDWSPSAAPEGRAGIDRPFVLGFVGREWERKGLMTVVESAQKLRDRGWKVLVRSVGEAPKAFAQDTDIDFVGWIDKSKHTERFLDVLASCDLGCLFSKREALGISTLEFLRAGVPVTGYDHEGTADTVPPDAGFRFPLSSTPLSIANTLHDYLEDDSNQTRFRQAARQWSKLLTWERCVTEMQELFLTGSIHESVRPWLGLSTDINRSNANVGVMHGGEVVS
jgi:glycosyltransferase involved in cell wall biosynthesis